MKTTVDGAPKQRGMHWMGIALLLALLMLVYVLFLQPKQSLRVNRKNLSPLPVKTNGVGGPTFEGCPSFPADNVWNTRIDGLPKLKETDKYSDSIGPLHGLHPDFGAKPTSGISVTLVPPGTVGVHVPFDYQEDSDDVAYPIPPDAKIEGGPNSEGDRHIVLVDARNCMLYELFAAEKHGSSWKAGSGIAMDLTSNSLRPDHKTSADAAGLPIFPGLVRYDETENGEIRHALRFTLPQTQANYVWPARHFASKLVSTNYPVMGQRFRLRATFDESKFSPEVRVIVVALKHYGMILADNGGTLYISGESDPRWNDDDLHKLSLIHAEDLEAVDESSLRMLPDSGRAKQGALPHQSGPNGDADQREAHAK